MAIISSTSGPDISHQRVRRDYAQLAVEVIRALRGRQSRAELSRRAGFHSNMVQRWELGQCWPSASRFLALHRQLRPRSPSWLEQFFRGLPAWAVGLDPTSPQAVAAFLTQLKGKTPILSLAEHTGLNRFSISRWLAGRAEPKLPDFLKLVDASSRRLLDLVATWVDPVLLSSLRREWKQLQLAREAAYDMPWSHGVLRALELTGSPRGLAAQRAWIARHLGLSREQVASALSLLETTQQVIRTKNGYRVQPSAGVVNTGDDPTRARGLKLAWTSTALERLAAGQPGRFGYSVFAVSRKDLARLHAAHLQHLRAMQDIIAHSSPSECVGLYCAQLLDLGGRFPDAPQESPLQVPNRGR